MKRLVVLALFVLPLGGVVASCSDDPPMTPADAGIGEAQAADAGPVWRTVLEDLDGSLLSIWGSSERDVWAVGGPLGNSGFEALVLRFDGARWRRQPVGKAESFWWVHGSSGSDVWLVGERGRITHWDGSGFTEVPSGTDATLYGVWATAAGNAWAVGGTPDQPNAANDVVLHWDGGSWTPSPLPSAGKTALFKVWGPDDSGELYVVGEGGTIWHRIADASADAGGYRWQREGEGLATGRLTTVAGCSRTEVYAVGGRDLLASNGTAWSRANVDPLLLVNELNGVSCSGGRVVVVGGGSLKLRLVDGVWQSDFGSVPFTDLHGAWADPSGAFWGVGGQFAASPRPNASRQGVVGRFGTGVVSGILAE
jgi:hypothetical protein